VPDFGFGLVLVAPQGLLDCSGVGFAFGAQQQLGTFDLLLLGQPFVVADQVAGDGNGIGHEEAHDGSVETEDDADVDFEEGHREAEEHHGHVIPHVGPIFGFGAFEEVDEFLARDEAEDGHHRQILQEDA
jgi:hypothetical protein